MVEIGWHCEELQPHLDAFEEWGEPLVKVVVPRSYLWQERTLYGDLPVWWPPEWWLLPQPEPVEPAVGEFRLAMEHCPDGHPEPLCQFVHPAALQCVRPGDGREQEVFHPHVVMLLDQPYVLYGDQ